MAVKDSENSFDFVQTLVPAARAATGTGVGVDLRGYDGATVVLSIGARTDGTFTPSIEESDDNSTFTAVGTAALEGTFSAATAGTSVQKVGYLGTKRYIRGLLTVASGTTGAVCGMSVIRTSPHYRPV